MTARRFPPPWSVEGLDACFVIKDDAGQKLAYVYFEEEPERALSSGLKLRREQVRAPWQGPDLPPVTIATRPVRSKGFKGDSESGS